MLFGDTAGGIKVKAFAPVHETTCIQAYTSVYACIQAFERGAKKHFHTSVCWRCAKHLYISVWARCGKHVYTSVCAQCTKTLVYKRLHACIRPPYFSWTPCCVVIFGVKIDAFLRFSFLMLQCHAWPCICRYKKKGPEQNGAKCALISIFVASWLNDKKK